MSILLEALKQKNQRAKTAVVSDAISESPSLSLVDIKQEKLDVPTESNDTPAEPMQTLVSMLSIEPPVGLDWQLKSSAIAQPIRLQDEKEAVASESSLSPQEGSFESILPTSAVTSASVYDVSLGLEIVETSVATDRLNQSVEVIAPPKPLNSVNPQPLAVSAAPSSLATTEQPVAMSVSSVESVSKVHTIDDGSVADAASGAKQSTRSERLSPMLDKSPLSAKRFLSFSRRVVPSPENNLASVNEAAQPSKHQISSYKVRQSILSVGVLLIGFGVVGYATLVAWEAQQASYMQDMAHYKNLALTALPEASEPAARINSKISDADELSFVTSHSETETARSLVASEPSASSTPLVPASATTEKSVKVLAEAEKQKASPFPQTQGVLDTNRAAHDQRSAKSSRVNVHDLAEVNLQQTQATGDMLMSAYQAWQLGHVAHAEQLYRQLLEKQPQQRDALLGMLAISQVSGSDKGIVLGYAEQLRRLYPQDREVRLATDRLLGDVSRDQASETELKLAQQSSENMAEASYRLGLFYAEQQRWAEAQSAFFEAVSKKPHQVDYRLNLAISYDRLGKQRLAIQHYQETLSLANLGLTKVDQHMIHERVAYLQSYRSSED